jgi:hypothetical protein
MTTPLNALGRPIGFPLPDRPARRPAFEHGLDPGNFTADGRQRRSLADLREAGPATQEAQRAIRTGSFASMMMCRVAPPKIIWRMRLCV